MPLAHNHKKTFLVTSLVGTSWSTSVVAGIMPAPSNVPEVSTAGALAAIIVVVGLAVLIYERRKSRS